MFCKYADNIITMRNEQFYKLQATFGNLETQGFKFSM